PHSPYTRPTPHVTSSLSLHDALPILASPRARPTELHSETHRGASNENGHAAVHCAPAYPADTLVRARARGIYAARVDTRSLAFEIGRAHVSTPVTVRSRMPSSA